MKSKHKPDVETYHKSTHQEKRGTTQKKQARPRFTCFLSMPYEFNDLRESIEKTLTALNEYEVECRYVTRATGKALRQEVVDQLKECDLIIGDVSSRPKHPKGPRPNIMWELGYAWRMELDIIIIVNKNETTNVASLIIDQHYLPYDPHNMEGFFRELRFAVESTCNRIAALKRQQLSESVYPSTVYIDRVEANFPRCIRETTDNIRILETNLEWVVDEILDYLVKALKDSKKPNLTVQLCTLNPRSSFARARALQLATLERDHEERLMSALHEAHRLLHSCDPARWELRVYDTFPTQITFTFGQRVFYSILSLGKRSREMLHFEVSLGNRNAGDTFRAHFNQIWSQSETYSDWIKKNRSTSSDVRKKE